MKRIILIVFLLIPILLNAQKRTRVRKKKRATKLVSIGYDIVNITDLKVKRQVFDGYTESMKWDKGYNNNIEVKIGFALNKHIDLLIGLGYNHLQIDQTDGFGYWSCAPTQSKPQKVVNAIRTVDLYSIKLPIEIRYNFKIKKIKIYPALGIIPIDYTNKTQNIELVYDNGTTDSHKGNNIYLDHNRKVNLASIFKVGVSYQLLKRIKLKIEPFYKINFGFDEIIEDYQNTILEGYGVLLGAEYDFDFKRQK